MPLAACTRCAGVPAILQTSSRRWRPSVFEIRSYKPRRALSSGTTAFDRKETGKKVFFDVGKRLATRRQIRTPTKPRRSKFGEANAKQSPKKVGAAPKGAKAAASAASQTGGDAFGKPFDAVQFHSSASQPKLSQKSDDQKWRGTEEDARAEAAAAPRHGYSVGKTKIRFGEEAQGMRKVQATPMKNGGFQKTFDMSPAALSIDKVEPLREMKVPTLAHGLDRVLFNPGVYWLRDPRSGIYNFDPRIRNVLDVDLFDYDTLPKYVTSSQDEELSTLAKSNGSKFVGSTSSLTGLLSQCYFLLSAWKRPDLSGFGAAYAKMPSFWSAGARLPVSSKLVYKDGMYAVDQDKESAGEASNSNYVLTSLGKSMEKMLTSTPEDYERHTRLNSWKVTEEERNQPENFHYAKSGSIMMRSQLDCSDPRLPRRTFDLKTRAVVAVRNDRANWVESSGYQIRHSTGLLESFEREYFDMIRAALLKYNFQARIGFMDGIFVCYHNTASVFGFQYLSVEEMNTRLFGSQEMADQSFKLSVRLLEELLEACAELYPSQSVKLTMMTNDDNSMTVYVGPEEGAELVRLDVNLDRWLDGGLVEGPVDFSAIPGRGIWPKEDDAVARQQSEALGPVDWRVDAQIQQRKDLSHATVKAELDVVQAKQKAITTLVAPNVDAINERERYRETVLAQNPEALRRFLEERSNGIAPGMPKAQGQAVGPITKEAQQVAKEAKVTPSGEPGGIFRKAQRQQLQRLRELSRLGAKDAAEQAKHDTLKQYEP